MEKKREERQKEIDVGLEGNEMGFRALRGFIWVLHLHKTPPISEIYFLNTFYLKLLGFQNSFFGSRTQRFNQLGVGLGFGTHL